MSPRKYVTDKPPHLEQYLLNLESQEEVRHPASPHAQSRITALVGTQHSRLDDLGEELRKLYQEATAVGSEQRTLNDLCATSIALSGADHFSVASDVLRKAFSEALRKERPNLLSDNTIESLRRGEKDSIKDLTDDEYRSILGHIAIELGNHPPFRTPTNEQVADAISSSLLGDETDSVIAEGHQIVENGTHPLLEPKWLVRDVLGYADGMMHPRSGGGFAAKDDNDRRLTTGEVVEHFRGNVAELLVIDRAALDDRRTFWNATIATLYNTGRWHQQLSNFIWRSGRQIAEFLINVYTRIPLFRATDSHNSEMGTVKLLVQNLGRKHAAHHPGSTESGPDKYVLIWVNRGSGWHSQSAEESPLFNALVHHLNDEGYLRSVPYGVAFHLVIAGQGDTRFILDSLGIDSSGRHFRTQFLDLGRIPADGACKLLHDYLIHHLIPRFDAQFQYYFKEHCDSFFAKLNQETMDAQAQESGGSLHPSLTADLAEFFLNQQVRYVGSSNAQTNCNRMISKFYKVVEDKSLFAGAYRRQLTDSMISFDELYISNALVQSVDRPDDLEPPENEPIDPPFRLFDWRQPRLLCTLARVMRHVVDKSAKRIARIAHQEAVRRHFKRSCEHLYGLDNPYNDWSSQGSGLDEWSFPELLQQQLDPILLQDAEEVLSELESSGCTTVARQVASAFKNFDENREAVGNTMTLNTFAVRRTVEGALQAAHRSTNESLASDLDGGTRQQQEGNRGSDSSLGGRARSGRIDNGTVDRAIANLLAAGFLETIFYRPYGRDEQRPIANASRYAGKMYRITNRLVLDKLC